MPKLKYYENGELVATMKADVIIFETRWQARCRKLKKLFANILMEERYGIR